MATRQEEFNNLCTIRNALDDIEQLQKKREDIKKQIRKYEDRFVEEYPKYSPGNYEGEAKAKLDINKENVSYGISFFTLIPSVIYGIYSGIKLWRAGGESLFDMILYVAFFFGPLCAAIVPYFGHAISAGGHLLFGWFISFAGEEALIYRDIFFKSALILLGAYAVWWLIRGISEIIYKKKLKKIQAESKKIEAERYASYLKAKATADIEIERKKRELKQDTETKTAALRQNISEINLIISMKKTLISQTPGLAEEDKNLYTVDTLVTYFKRGKADSIKEAINLYDAEEHQKKMDSEAQAHRRMMQYQQNIAIMDMKDAQRRHNEAMEEEQRMQNEAVRRRLDKINDKVDEFINDANR